jgi:hypothetical protein
VDGSVDVDGNVDLSDRNLTKLPLKFGEVSGNFWCFNNQLISLEGCPHSVGRDFNCQYNQLTTLEGSPNSVGDDFYCYNNQLTTLELIPDIFGVIRYHNNPIYTVCSEWLKNYEKPDMDTIDLFKDLDIIVGNKLYWSKLEYFHEEIGVDIPDRKDIDPFYKIID